jgi:hypothetical protein
MVEYINVNRGYHGIRDGSPEGVYTSTLFDNIGNVLCPVSPLTSQALRRWWYSYERGTLSGILFHLDCVLYNSGRFIDGKFVWPT